MADRKLLGEMEPPDQFEEKLAGLGDHVPFYFHFGMFMALFASVESHFHFFFHRQCGLDEATARAIIGGEQLKKVTSACNNLVKASQWSKERKDSFQQLIDQMNAISELRHNLVHRGVDRIKGGITSSNAMTAKSREAIEELSFNLEHIKNAAADLRRILFELVVCREPEFRADLLPNDVQVLLSQPWRYKRIAPNKPNQQPRKDVL